MRENSNSAHYSCLLCSQLELVVHPRSFGYYGKFMITPKKEISRDVKYYQSFANLLKYLQCET